MSRIEETLFKKYPIGLHRFAQYLIDRHDAESFIMLYEKYDINMNKIKISIPHEYETNFEKRFQTVKTLFDHGIFRMYPIAVACYICKSEYKVVSRLISSGFCKDISRNTLLRFISENDTMKGSHNHTPEYLANREKMISLINNTKYLFD